MIWLSLLLSSTAWASPKHVVMVVWDTTRADHLSAYGYQRDTTPNLKRIASEGTLYQQAVSAGSWTIPSTASLFTGMFTHNHQVDFAPTKEERRLELSGDVTTLAETMKGAGYSTAIYSAQGIFMKKEGFLQGFDEHEQVGDDNLVRKGLARLDAASGKTFTVLWFLDPHSAYTPDTSHDKWSKSGMDVNLRGCPKEDTKEFPATWYRFCDINEGAVTLEEAEWAALRARYDGELHEKDAQLGELWSGLASRGVADDMLFVFTSDHGEGFNEHSRARSWHILPYEHNQRVPLVLWGKGVPSGKRVSAAVRTVDIYPTIAKAVGASVPSLNGEDLLAASADRPVVAGSFTGHGHLFFRDGNYKLIQSRRGRPWTELYDLKNDPAEQNDLSGNASLLAKVTAAMNAFLESSTLEVAGGRNANTEDVDALRALGYVE